MLYISKWKATAILLTAFIVCLCAVPNFFPESMVKRWPAWAQRHIVLGLDLQGGSHILLEVDANDVRKQKLVTLQDDVRRVLREARVGLVRAPVIRGNSVEVVIRESDLQQGLAKLRELSQPLSGFIGTTGQRSLDVENVGGGLVRLTATEPAILERIRQVVDQSVEIIGRARQPARPGRAVDPAPGQRPRPGAGAGPRRSAAASRHSRQDRQADVSPGRHVDAGRAGLAGAPAAGIGDRVRLEGGESATLSAGEAGDRVGRGAHRRAARLRPAQRRADRLVQVQHLRRPQIRPGHAGERRTPVRHRARRRGDLGAGHPRADPGRKRPDFG